MDHGSCCNCFVCKIGKALGILDDCDCKVPAKKSAAKTMAKKATKKKVVAKTVKKKPAKKVAKKK